MSAADAGRLAAWRRRAAEQLAVTRADRRARPGRDEAELELGRCVVGWALRAVLGVLVVACAVLVTTGGGPAVAGDVLVAGAVLVVRPGRVLPAVVVAVVGAHVLVAGTPPLAALLLLVLALHLLLVCAAVAGRVGLRARVEVAVLLAVLRDALPVQVAGQALAVVGWVAHGWSTGGGEGVRVAALVLAAGGIVVALGRPRATWFPGR